MIFSSLKRINHFSQSMLKFLLPLLLVSAIGYYSWNHFQKTPEPTPEEKIALIRSQASCTALELGELAESHPKLVERELKGRILSVSGILSKALVKGVKSTDLILELEGAMKTKIDFHSDFERFTRMGEGLKPGLFKFQKFGHEIILFQAAPNRQNSQETSEKNQLENSTSIEPIVKFREGDHYTLKGLFQHVATKRVRLELRELP
jgi:hypothetical protein